MEKFEWKRDTNGGWKAEAPGNVTLVVSPSHYARGFVPKAARGAKWLAQCSHWEEATRTMSRFGRDEYMNPQSSAKDAMQLAESIYATATA
jgi:hypothetical protein